MRRWRTSNISLRHLRSLCAALYILTQGCTLTQNRRSHKRNCHPKRHSRGHNDSRARYLNFLKNILLNASAEGASAFSLYNLRKCDLQSVNFNRIDIRLKARVSSKTAFARAYATVRPPRCTPAYILYVKKD